MWCKIWNDIDTFQWTLISVRCFLLKLKTELKDKSNYTVGKVESRWALFRRSTNLTSLALD